MRVLIPGIDGYIGWSLALNQLSKGNQVCGFDNFSRRKNVEEMDSHSGIPIISMSERIIRLTKDYGDKIRFVEGDLLDAGFTDTIIKDFQPDVVVHLAEQPSAPYSMIDQKHNVYTQQNNVIGNLNLLHTIQRHSPNAHLIKLGTMGEYGTPNIDIEEGWIDINHKGRTDKFLFPRQASSLYHTTKI